MTCLTCESYDVRAVAFLNKKGIGWERRGGRVTHLENLHSVLDHGKGTDIAGWDDVCNVSVDEDFARQQV